MDTRPKAPVRVARGVHVPAADADSLLAVCAGVIETSAADSVVACTTAARLHGLWLPPSSDPMLHVATADRQTVGRLMTRTRRPEIRAHRFQLRHDDVTILQGVPVTSLARTWLDLSPTLSLPDLVAAGDSALRAGATPEGLRTVLDRNRACRGLRQARTALNLLDARSRSRPESHLRVAISGPEMPAFAVNEPVHRDEGGWLAEPDLSLTGAKIALEYQGADHADITRMRKDLTRSTDLRLEHWLVLLYGPAEVFGRPWQIRLEVRRGVAGRAPHLLRRPRAGSERQRCSSGRLRVEWSDVGDHSMRN